MTDYTAMYRPHEFDQVVGQEHVLESLQNIVKSGRDQAFLFTGPSGTGKTTLARIVATELGCTRGDIREIDAATYTSINDMRQVTETLTYHGFGGSGKRALIVDECHALSKQAWQALLKAIEEPPEGVYWLLCTTEGHRVPDTIKTRCAAFELRPVSADAIYELLVEVAAEEEFDTDPDDLSDILDLIAKQSGGSPRRALKFLSQCAHCATRKEAARTIRAAEAEGDAVIELCRMLATRQGLTWANVVTKIGEVRDQNPESIRIVIVNYLATAILGTKSPDKAAVLIETMQPFMRQYNDSEKTAPLLLSFGEVLFGEAEE